MRMIFLSQMRFWFSFLLLCAVSFSFAQEEITGNDADGFKLFDKHCSVCHNPTTEPLTGPGLLRVSERLQVEKGLGREWLQKWILNNETLRSTGDVYANEVYEKYNKAAMNVFENILSEKDVDDILVYLNDPATGEASYKDAMRIAEEEEEAARLAAKANSGGNTGLFIISFVILAALLIWILVRINTLVKLTKQAAELKVKEEKRIKSVSDVFEKYKNISNAAMGVLTLLAFFGLWNFLLGVGVDKGYQPEQPIYFSHKVHNEIQGVDCQYCHSSAKYGKVSGIPSANLCMNCHKSISEYKGEDDASKRYLASLVNSGKYESKKEIKKFYTGEIQKMYKAIGWDKESKNYIDSLQEPIQWLRIHNMPDFVYFPHSQHVVVGEKAIKKAMEEGTIPNAEELDVNGNDPVCFACHGDVGKMDEVYMANKFTMGWCIECHRTTEVDMENGYNKEYYQGLHEKLKEEYGDETAITVDAIGGLECGKCHY